MTPDTTPYRRTLPTRDLSPLPPVGRAFIGGFESTFLPARDVDLIEATGHERHRAGDLDHLMSAGVRHLRYPLRWHRIEESPGAYQWDETDRVLGDLADRGAVPIVDLVHHTSYPSWLQDGFRDRRFADAFVVFAAAVANRYPQLQAYTLFNEPFATLFLAGHEALWPPYERGAEGFVRLATSVLPALSTAAQCWAELLPDAHHVWVDTAEHHSGTGVQAEYVEFANDRRHSCLDLFLGHDLDPQRPFLRALIEAGGESLLSLPPGRVDVLGLDYYCHSEWYYDADGARSPSPVPAGLAAVAQQYWSRYGLPMMLSETNLRGLPTDRATWLRYTLEQYESALAQGIPLHGYCWFPQVDSCDWDSLLARGAGRLDPVGVLEVDADRERRRTLFTDVWERAAVGAPVAELPAYRLQAPCDEQLAAVVAGLPHWPWQDPPAAEQQPATNVAPTDGTDEHGDGASAGNEPDLVVLSHLRWTWVWQRPQHIVSRLGVRRAAGGARTWFVEEPVKVPHVSSPQVRTEQYGDVTRAWLEVPTDKDELEYIGFGDPAAAEYAELLAELIGDPPRGRDVWLYTPMAYDVAVQLSPRRLVYDVMDDLASFHQAPQGLRLRQRRLLASADIVFTGGRSLHRLTSAQRHSGVHCLPSGVESAHYAASRGLRRSHERPVAGYVGVVDERLDLRLLGEFAERLPDWDVRVIGPVAKIDAADLPQAPNLEYVGLVPYPRLPQAMAGFDVAIMPFALNDATRAISPTKTLEYLAAGLPVVSTRIPDLLTDYRDVVHFADDAAAFADACEHVLDHAVVDRDARSRTLQARHEWDFIVDRMCRLLDEATGSSFRRQRTRSRHDHGARMPRTARR